MHVLQNGKSWFKGNLKLSPVMKLGFLFYITKFWQLGKKLHSATLQVGNVLCV